MEKSKNTSVFHLYYFKRWYCSWINNLVNSSTSSKRQRHTHCKLWVVFCDCFWYDLWCYGSRLGLLRMASVSNTFKSKIKKFKTSFFDVNCYGWIDICSLFSIYCQTNFCISIRCLGFARQFTRQHNVVELTDRKDGVNTDIHNTYGQIRQSSSRPRFMDTSNNILLHYLSRSDWTHLSYLALSSSFLVFPRSISTTLCRLVYITNHILVLHLFLSILSVEYVSTVYLLGTRRLAICHVIFNKSVQLQDR